MTKDELKEKIDVKLELRNKIRCALGYCEVRHTGECYYDTNRNQAQEVDLIMSFIDTYSKEECRLARVDELEKALPKMDDDTGDSYYISVRLSELKGELNNDN